MQAMPRYRFEDIQSDGKKTASGEEPLNTDMDMFISWRTDKQFEPVKSTGPRKRYEPTGGVPGYHREAFLMVQDLLSRTISEEVSGKPTNDIEIRMRRLPYPPHYGDAFLSALKSVSIFVVIGYVYTVINISKNVVREKELRLKVSGIIIHANGQ